MRHYKGEKMALPLIPIGILAVSGISAVFGAKKGYDAVCDNNEAKKTNDAADLMIEESRALIDIHRKASQEALEELGAKKLYILNNEIKSLIEIIENIEVKDSVGLNELNNFKIDKQDFIELKEMSSFATSILSGTAAGGLGGALSAFGAYSAAQIFATASSGTAIATLSGAAATNATLAFFGGGAIAAGGLGVAGGMAVLGGLVAGPALAVMGLITSAKASALKDDAYSNLAKAKKYAKELQTASIACDGIRRRANMFYAMLVRLSALVAPINDELSRIVQRYCDANTKKADPKRFSDEEINVLNMSFHLLKCVKTLLDTPLLTQNGELTNESKNALAKIAKQISQMQK